jgi:hypothetical protein
MPDAARQTMRTWRLFGGAAVPCALIVLTLMAIGVARYPASLQGSGNRLLWTNITLLLTYGLAGIWVWCQRRSDVLSAIRIGATAGLLLGAIFLANHAIELFVRDRDFALVITPVFLAFALLGAVGSAAWQRTRSLVLAAIAGVWCAVVATLILISVVLAFNLAFAARAELPLREPLAASGMTDHGAFLERNSLQAASEGLVRMPVLALLLSLLGASANAWIARWSRTVVLAAAWIAPIFLVMGAAALWSANSLARSARPPLVLAGVLLSGVALAAAHPIAATRRRSRRIS